MSEENKNVPEDNKPVFDDSVEPIESIEKTVEELKRKIQELSEKNAAEAEVKPEEDPGIPEFAEPEVREEPEEAKDTAANLLNDSIETIKEKTEQVMSSPDLQKTLDFIRSNAVKAVSAARTKLDEISADPKVQEVSRKTAETFKNAADTIGEAVKPVVQNVDAFMNKPEVQEKLADLRTAAAEVTDKAVDTVKDLLKIDDEDTSRSEEDTEDKNDTE